MSYPAKPAPVAHLCPALALAMRIVRRHTPVGHPDRKVALDALREVRDGVHQLRVNAQQVVFRPNERVLYPDESIVVLHDEGER